MLQVLPPVNLATPQVFNCTFNFHGAPGPRTSFVAVSTSVTVSSSVTVSLWKNCIGCTVEFANIKTVYGPTGASFKACPEGVEAGWCEDEDERQDFDCDDPDMENDPRCKDREPVNGSEEEIEPEVIEEELPEEQEEEPTEEQNTEIEPIEEEEDNPS